MKNPLTPAGIEPATFRFVAQHLNHCTTVIQNVKGKIHPITGHKGPEREYRYSSTLSLTLVLDGGRFTPGKDPVPIV